MNEKVIFAGFGGQGVMLMGQLLSYAATEKDLNTLWLIWDNCYAGQADQKPDL